MPMLRVAPIRVAVRSSVMPASTPGRDATENGPQSHPHTRSSRLTGMDAIAGLLDGPRARRAFLLRCTMDPPWALRVQDEAPLSLVAMLRGSAWFVPDQ